MKPMNIRRKVTVTWECEEFAFNGKLYDVVADLTFNVEPGDPGCYRTPNGDGWPRTGPEYELQSYIVRKCEPAVEPDELSDFSMEIFSHLEQAEKCDTPEWQYIIGDVNAALEDCYE